MLSARKKILLVEKPSDLLYLRWFSRRLAEKGQTALDPAWTIVPCGEIDKIRALTSLVGGGTPDVAVLLSSSVGQNSNALGSKNSELLRNCRVFTVDMYLDAHGGCVEDLIGREAYFALVNLCYKLPRKFRLDVARQASSDECMIKEVEDHFRALPPGMPELDLYAPAEYLAENGKKLIRKLRDLNGSFSRFETLFRDLNSC
jgi:hypothetical protein